MESKRLSEKFHILKECLVPIQSPFKVADDVTKILNKRGIEGGFSKSETDFGQSAYYAFYDANGEMQKVRISDHSVGNKKRLSDEIHYNNKSNPNPYKIANTIERLIYPDMYNFIEDKNGGYFLNGKRGNYYRLMDDGGLAEGIKTEQFEMTAHCKI